MSVTDRRLLPPHPSCGEQSLVPKRPLQGGLHLHDAKLGDGEVDMLVGRLSIWRQTCSLSLYALGRVSVKTYGGVVNRG